MRTGALTKTCTQMLRVALFTMAKKQKQAKCPSSDEWIIMWCTHTMEYHSATKGTKALERAII